MTEKDIYTEEEQNLERGISRIDEIIAANSKFLNGRKDSAHLLPCSSWAVVGSHAKPDRVTHSQGSFTTAKIPQCVWLAEITN